MADIDANPSAAINVGSAERALSAVLGAALVVNGIVRPSLWHTVLAFMGAALVQRGLTGNCALYRGLGLSTADEALPRRRPREYLSHGDYEGDPVMAASEDSFPASDPPPWTPTSVGNPNLRH